LEQLADAASHGRIVGWDMSLDLFGGCADPTSFAYLTHIDFFFFTPSSPQPPPTTGLSLFSFPFSLQKMDDLFDGAIGIDLGTTYS
jgi:hypothetical protein